MRNPTTQTEEHNYSQRLSAPLTALIVQQSEDLGGAQEQQQAIKLTLRAERLRDQKSTATELINRLPRRLQHVANLASEKGASSWLTTLPFVMSSTGGIGPCATVVLKRLGGLLAEKHTASYSSVMGLLQCRLSFALLRSSIMCIRGSRSSRWHPGRIGFTTTDLAVSEGNVSLH